MKLLVGDTLQIGRWINFKGLETGKKYKVVGVTRENDGLYYEFTKFGGSKIVAKYKVSHIDTWVATQQENKILGGYDNE